MAIELDVSVDDGVPVLKQARKSDVIGQVQATAARHNIDQSAFTKAANIESGFDPKAKAKTSSAAGVFQITKKTAKALGLKDPFDTKTNIEAAARLWNENKTGLSKRLGRVPTNGEIYLAHQQGLHGASRLLANPNAKAVDIVGTKAVLNNGGSRKMTAGEFAGMWTAKIDGGGLDLPASFGGAVRQEIGPASSQDEGFLAPSIGGPRRRTEAIEEQAPTRVAGDVVSFPTPFGGQLSSGQINQLRTLSQQQGVPWDLMQYLVSQQLQARKGAR